MEKFQIGGFQKLSLLDYPGKICAIVFTNGCNFRCSYCHNYEFVEDINQNKLFNSADVINYLIKRKNVLDGLTITGGEPTIQKGLKDFIIEVKNKTGLLIKLDTNGLNTDILKELIDKKLIDYVAMDIKGDFENYEKITRIKKIDVEKIKKSIEIIKKSSIEHEFRTTVIKNYHNVENLRKIIKFIDDDENYYLQKFIISDNVPNKELISYEDNEINLIYEELKSEFSGIRIRGIKGN